MHIHSRTVQRALIGIGILAVLGALYFFYGPGAKDRMIPVGITERIENEELEFSFAFESGPDALGYTQSAPGAFEDSTLMAAYVLMNNTERTAYQSNPEEVETPPAISVLVFARTEEDDATATGTPKRSSTEKVRDWAIANSGFSQIDRAQTDIEEIKIDGAPAIHYVSEGVYTQDTYVVKYGDKMYLFVGQYIEESDGMHTAFEEIIASVLFI